MNNLKNITKLVKSILEENPQTRNSDSYLYFKVIEHVAKMKGIDTRTLNVRDFWLCWHSAFPKTETVRRTRQKLQATFPELAACESVQLARMENEKEFRGYALAPMVGEHYEN